MKAAEFIKKPAVQWSAFAVVVLIVLYYLYKPEIKSFLSMRKGKKDGSNKLAINPSTGQTDITVAATLDIDIKKRLKRGSEGNEVVVLQQLINEYGYKPELSTDGIFGNKTQTAVRDLMGSPQLTVSISDFVIWRAKNLVSHTGATIPGNTGINPNWWLSIITP